jgi:hypothetical protein
MTGFERWALIVRRRRGEGKIFATVCTLFILAERMLHQFELNLRCSDDATSDARRGAAQAQWPAGQAASLFHAAEPASAELHHS